MTPPNPYDLSTETDPVVEAHGSSVSWLYAKARRTLAFSGREHDSVPKASRPQAALLF